MSSDQKRLISGDDSGLVIVWDLATRSEVARWTVDYWVVAAALSPTARRPWFRSIVTVATISTGSALAKTLEGADQKLKLNLFKETDRENSRKFFSAGLVTAAFSPDGQLLAVDKGRKRHRQSASD